MYSHFILERNLGSIPEIQLQAMRDKAHELRMTWEAENAAALREWRERVRKAQIDAERVPKARIPVVGGPVWLRAVGKGAEPGAAPDRPRD
jgi:hypothetical protein